MLNYRSMYRGIKLNKKLLFLISIPLILFVLAGFKIYYAIYLWHYTGEEKTFEIRPGEGFPQLMEG